MPDLNTQLSSEAKEHLFHVKKNCYWAHTHTHIFVFRLNYKSSVRAACFDQLLAFVALRSLFVRTLFLERISSDFSRLIKSPSLTLSSKVFLLYTYIYVLGVTEICQSYKQSFATVSEKKHARQEEPTLKTYEKQFSLGGRMWIFVCIFRWHCWVERDRQERQGKKQQHTK